MSPLMKKVENAGKKGIQSKRKPYQISTEDFFNDTETLRSHFAQLINSSASSIAVIPSVSYGMANVINNLPDRRGKIIITEGQFPSNVYPWQNLSKRGIEIVTIPAPRSAQKGQEWNEQILQAIDEDTIMVAIGHIHWADGTLFLLDHIRTKLDLVDGLLIIDGTQSVGALPFDIQAIRPDALICAGYKWLMGPYSIGLAYYGERFINGNPIEQNWINRHNSEDFSGLVNYEEDYRDGAARFDVGERSNFILTPMMIEAIKQINKWTPSAIQAYCDGLTREAIEYANQIGFESEERHYRSAHLFGLKLPKGISAVKAMKVFKQNKVSLSLRGETIRVSPHVYNDQVDVRKFVRSLDQIVGKKA